MHPLEQMLNVTKAETNAPHLRGLVRRCAVRAAHATQVTLQQVGNAGRQASRRLLMLPAAGHIR